MTFKGSPFGRWPLVRLPILIITCILTAFVLINLRCLSQEHQEHNITLAGKSIDHLPAVVKCADSPPPNLILTAIDGPKWADQIFIFTQSLEAALGREALEAKERPDRCPPTPVAVKIITPQQVARHLPIEFKVLMRRYPFLEFVGALPDREGVGVVFRRFQGFSNILGGALSSIAATYDKVFVCDLDVVFQRNPFDMPMKPGVELLYFAEWRGLKIGHCNVHKGWFDGCAHAEGGPFIPEEQSASYMSLDRICAGSTYGTSRAMAIYLRTMASELLQSGFQCNDQAMHIHLYYSNLLDAKLSQAGVGRVWVVPNEEALLGTVGTTPMVRINEWGEILNELDEVQLAVHQYKTHNRLSQIVWNRYGWITAVGTVAPPIPALTEHKEMKEGEGSEYSSESESQQPQKLLHYRLGDANSKSCSDEHSLCSCKYGDCQMDYAEFGS
jgi:hypothetical protein